LADLPESILPQVVWEEVPPADVLSGLVSLAPAIKVEGRIVAEPGRGVDTTLEWAKDELVLAEESSSDEERLASQAIIHAQCAVECLLDTYLERDWLTEKLPLKAGMAQKVELLAERPDLQVPQVLLSKFVTEPRHDIIHRYETRTVKDARIAVEAASGIIAQLKASSDPHNGPVFAGTLSVGMYSNENGHESLWFMGFSGPFGLTWRGSDSIVRVATGVAQDKTRAEVLWAPIRGFSKEEHWKLLLWWDSLQPSSCWAEDLLRKRLSLAGLDTPLTE
jgi:hypothetical protein